MKTHATATAVPPLLDKADCLEGLWVIEDMSDLTDAAWLLAVHAGALCKVMRKQTVWTR